jgi:hypothetical protein
MGLELPAGRGRVSSRFSTARRAFAVLDLTSSKTLSKDLGVSLSTCDCPINILFGLLSDGDVTVARVESPRRKPPPRSDPRLLHGLARARHEQVLDHHYGPRWCRGLARGLPGPRKVGTSGGQVGV